MALLSCMICRIQMEADHLDYHIDTQHPSIRQSTDRDVAESCLIPIVPSTELLMDKGVAQLKETQIHKGTEVDPMVIKDGFIPSESTGTLPMDLQSDVQLAQKQIESELHTTEDLGADLLLKVIWQMRNHLDNVQVMVSCHQLINQYSVEQIGKLGWPLRLRLSEDFLSAVQLHRQNSEVTTADQNPTELGQLESSLQREVVKVLVAGLKLHSDDSCVVQTICNLLITSDLNRDHFDGYLEAIDSLLAIICDETKLTPTAKTSAMCLLEMVIITNRNQRRLMREKCCVEKICESIRLQLCQSGYDQSIEMAWKCLSCLCGDSLNNQKRFLNSDGLDLFRLCCQKFYKTDNLQADNLATHMMSIMLRLSVESYEGDESFRQDLKFVWKIWRKSNSEVVAFKCCRVFFNFLRDSTIIWTFSRPSEAQVEKQLRLTMLNVIKSDSFRNDMSDEFGKIFEFLWGVQWWGERKDPQIRYFFYRIFTKLLCMAPTDWPLGCPTVVGVKWYLWGRKWWQRRSFLHLKC